MRKLCTLAVLLAFVFIAGTLLAQSASNESCSNPEAIAKMVNPVKATPEAIALGKKYYGYDCAMCHGTTGNGKGDVESSDKLPDFTNPDSLKGKTDAELFCTLKMGKGHMPVEPARTSQNDLWSLILYVRSLAK